MSEVIAWYQASPCERLKSISLAARILWTRCSAATMVASCDSVGEESAASASEP